MAYIIQLSCSACGATAPSAHDMASARNGAEAVGWLLIKHTGEHFCPPCRIAYEESKAAQFAAKHKISPDGQTTQQAATVALRERGRLAISLRSSGLKWSEVGAALNVTPQRAVQIHRRAMAEEKAAALIGPTEPEFEMTVKLWNILTHGHSDRRNTRTRQLAEQLSWETERSFLRRPSTGPKALHEAKQMLAFYGLSFSPS